MPPSRFIEVDEARQNNLKGITRPVPIGARDGGDRRGRRRQVLARLRRALRRGPPPLRRDLQPLRAAVPRAARPAARRAHRGRAAGGGGRPHRARAHLALDRRHDDVGRRLPARALRARGRPPLPAVRPAGAPRHAVVDLRERCSTREGRTRARLLPAQVGQEGRRPGWCARRSRRPGFRRVLEDGRAGAHRGRAPAPGGRRRHRRARPRAARGATSGSGSSTRSRPRCARRRAASSCASRARRSRAASARALHCARCDIAYGDPSPALFSFNNPVGACPTCKGFGRTMAIDPELVIPDPRRTHRGRRGQAVPDRASTATARTTSSAS